MTALLESPDPLSQTTAPASVPGSRRPGGGLLRYILIRFLLIIPTIFILVTVVFFVAVPGYTALVRRLPRSRTAPSALHVEYRDGEGVLRSVLAECTQLGFAVHHLSSRRRDGSDTDGVPSVVVRLEVQGRGVIADLAADLADLDGVLGVEAEDVNVNRE